MSEQLRIGVIGASWHSDLRHLPALKSHPRAQTVAICDIRGMPEGFLGFGLTLMPGLLTCAAGKRQTAQR
jgi:hypothetical protein